MNVVVYKTRGLWNARLIVADSLPSTNRWMLAHAGDFRHGDILRAVRQTAGHGRFGRPWRAAGDRALTCSVFLDTTRLADRPLRHAARAAALAVARTLDEHGLTAGLKWPNDVWIGYRKIAGILAERENDGPLVLGIGLNADQSPADFAGGTFRHPPTSVRIESGRPCPPDTLLFPLARHLENILNALEASDDGLNAEWAVRDILSGRILRVETPAGLFEGRYAGLDADGRLILETGAGGKRRFTAAEVTIRDVP